MSEWTIQRITGLDAMGNQTVENIAVVHELEYHGGWMDDGFVSVNVKSAEPIDWHFDDFLTYRDEIYSISYDPNVVKKARRGTYGDGFTYDNIKLYSLGYKMRNYGFKDVVLNDNQLPYTMLETFSFFCSTIEDFADRLQANFNREQQSLLTGGFIVLTPSQARTAQRLSGALPAEWNQYYNGDEDTGETDVNIDVDKQTCRDVLKYSYEKFGLSYYVVNNLVIIGGKPLLVNSGSANIFRYGKGLGLYEIERTSDEEQEMVTKLFAYGSTENIAQNYYAEKLKKYYLVVTSHMGEEGAIGGWEVTDIEWTTENQLFGHTDKRGHYITIVIDGHKFFIQALEMLDDQDKKHLVLDLMGSNIWPQYKPLPLNQRIYITEGINKDNWPSDHIEMSSFAYPAALSINRLMLPGFPTQSLNDWMLAKIASTSGEEKAQWTALYGKYDFSTTPLDPWIKSKNASEMGVFEGSVNYDGSQQREIKPTIDNMDGCMVDHADEISDNGYLPEGTSLRFEICVMATFNLVSSFKNRTSSDDVYINMTSGYCNSRSFKINDVKNGDAYGYYVLVCERSLDSNMNRYFPYDHDGNGQLYQIKQGDKFNITGIDFPDEYVEAAAEKMLIASCGYLDKRDHMRYTYLPKIDELFMARQHDEAGGASYYSRIHAGMKMEFEDSDLGIWKTTYIDVLTIKENGNNGIPTYDVVLRDEKEKSTFEKLTDNIKDLTANPPTQIVERQRRTLQYIDYVWEADGTYYCETLNTDTDILETSRCWHNNILWECLRTFTDQEPLWGCTDWKAVGGDMNYYCEIVSSAGTIFRNGNVSTVLTMSVSYGQEEITAKLIAHPGAAIVWGRNTGWDDSTQKFVPTSEDGSWVPTSVSGQPSSIRLSRSDMGSGWMADYRQALFHCSIYADDEYPADYITVN